MKRILSLLASLLFILASCSGRAKDHTPTDVLRIGVMPSVDHLPLAIALEQGYYDSLGLSLELINFASPMERDAALQAGELDGVVTDYTTALLQHQKGLPVGLLSATNGSFTLITNPKAQITTLGDLKGKRIALSSNTVIEFATDKLLYDAMLGRQDVTIVEVQKIPLRLEMLARGEVDAAILPQPFAQIALGRGLQTLPEVANATKPIMKITGIALHTKNTEHKQKAIRKLVQGYDQAVDYLNRTDRAQWTATLARVLGVEQEVARQIPLATFSPMARPEAFDVLMALEWLGQKGLIPSSYQGEGAILSLPK